MWQNTLTYGTKKDTKQKAKSPQQYLFDRKQNFLDKMIGVSR